MPSAIPPSPPNPTPPDASANPTVSASAARTEEFVGPFASWLNVKTFFGVKGDGVTDDTAALQRALTFVTKAGANSTLFVPTGTYVISNTLSLFSAAFVAVIGEDPHTTILKWNGTTPNRILHIDGVTLS